MGPEEDSRDPRVLVVDDDEIVRRMICRVLSTHGYEVAEASNGKKALEILEDKSRRVDLVLTDMVMPEMGGAQLVERLSDASFKVKVLGMSAYIETQPLSIPFIQKPFTPQGLLAKIREALA